MSVYAPTTDQVVLCYHCGEQCADDHITAHDRDFCCQGCRLVFELLQDNGMCRYYEIGEHPGYSLKFASESGRFSYLDDEAIRLRLLEFSDGRIAKLRFYLPQIHCSSCIWLLENLHRLNENIIHSEVNFLKKEIFITFSEQGISLGAIAALLTKVGYEPEIHLDRIEAKKSDPALTTLYLKIGLAGFAFGNLMLFAFPEYLADAGGLEGNFSSVFRILSLVLATPVLFYSASDWFRSAWYSLKEKNISLDVPVAMGIASIYLRSVYDIVSGTGPGYMDSFTGLVFFLLIGKLFQRKTFETLSFERDYKSYFPLSVTKIAAGSETLIPVSTLKPGDTIYLRNGELVPADSVLVSESAYLNYSFVTGESEPVEIRRGSLIYAGGRVTGPSAEMETVKEVSHSYLAQLWNNEIFQKDKPSFWLTISDRFGKYFTLFTIALAFGAAIFWLPDIEMSTKVLTAVLIIACPCALTLAAPFALGTTLSVFGKAKFYLKNTGVIADLAKLDTIVFDKTGTLTSLEHSEVEFTGKSLTPDEYGLIASVLKNSTHPLARKISLSLGKGKTYACQRFHEVPGCGVHALADGRLVQAGSREWLQKIHPEISVPQSQSSTVHIVIDNHYKGCFTVRNSFRKGIERVLEQTGKFAGTWLLSGDNEHERALFRRFFADDAMNFSQRPEDKLRFIRSLQEQGRYVAMVGDGLNDAGALRQSNVGIAVVEASGNFSPACDAILSAENFSRLPDYIRFSKTSLNVVTGAFIISVFYNAIGLGAAVTGLLSPVLTAILMPVSSLTVIGFATFAIRILARRRNLYTEE